MGVMMGIENLKLKIFNWQFAIQAVPSICNRRLDSFITGFEFKGLGVSRRRAALA